MTPEERTQAVIAAGNELDRYAWHYIGEGDAHFLICGAIRAAVEAERERCAKVAKALDCDEPGLEYMALDILASDWERYQCWHGDRIAAAIREGKNE